MRKKIMKCFALLLSAALVLGSVNYTSANVQAGDGGEAMAVSGGDVSGGDVSGGNGGETQTATARYYTFNDLTKSGGYGFTDSVSDAGVVTLNFNSQYQEVQYNLPAGVDASTLKNITLDVSSDHVSSLCIKILVDGTSVQDVYETNTIDVTADLSGGTVTFAIMNKASEAIEGVTIDNIKITAVQTGGSETEPSTSTGGNEGEGGEQTETARYYTFNDLTKSGGYGFTDSVSEAGVVTLNFNSQYQEVQYSLPAGVDATTLKNITLDVSSDHVSSLCIKILVDGTSVQDVYETNTIDVTADLSGGTVTFAIMNKASEAIEGVTIDNIKITAVQTGGSETEPSTSTGGGEGEGGEQTETARYYTFNDLTKSGGYGFTDSVSEAGVVTLNFNGQYQEVRYALPAGVDATTLKNITLDVSSDHVSSLCIKILVDGTSVQDVYETNTIDVTADLSGGTVTFAIMNKASEAIEGVTIDNIKITAVQTGGSETEPSTSTGGGEATETARYYTFNDLTKSGGYGFTDSVSEAGVVTLNFNSQYQEVRYALPAGVDATTLKNITLDVSSDHVSSLCIKILVDGTSVQDVYETNTIDVTADLSSGTVTFAIMNKASEAIEGVTIDNIKITAVQTGGSETEPSTSTGGSEGGEGEGGESGEGGEGGETGTATSMYYTFNDMTKASGGWGNTPSVDATYGVLTLALSGQYAEIIYNLPEGVDATTLEKIVLDVSEGTGTNLSLKIYADGEQAQVQYNSATITVNETTKAALAAAETVTIGIMNSATDAASYKIDNIKITAVQTGGSETEPDNGSNVELPTEVTSKYYTFKEVSNAGGYGYTELISDGGVLTAGFSGQYQEVRYSLPSGVVGSTLESITLDVLDGNEANIALKILVDGTAVQTAYNAKTINVTADLSEGTVTFAIMSMASEAIEGIVIENILITAAQTGGSETEPDNSMTEPIQTYEKTYAAAELVKATSNATTCELTDAGWTMTFAELNLETRFTLPETLNMEDCVSVTFKVSSQTGPVNFHLALDGTKVKNFWYNVDNTAYTLSPGITSKVNQFMVQCGGEEYTEGSAITIESITFKMLGEEPLPAPEDNVYTSAYFEVEEASDGVVVTEGATTEDPMTIEFPAEGDSVIFEIPDSVDVNHLVSIDFDIETAATLSLTSATLPGVEVTLLNKDKNPIMGTEASSISTGCNPEIKYIKITALAADTGITLNSITFNVDENAFEAIVLNGYFTRDDLSMWGSAVYGTVDGTEDGEATAITIKTDAAVPGENDTYGEISRRSSPYVCFAQDISQRVEPGKTYSFQFYAKLSEDYADAPANMREITFSPYYLDANGNAQYGLTPEGAYKKSLEVGEWTLFIGSVTVPANATGFVIRILEQGTNYGQGSCVLGSYAVTGVTMNEMILPEKEPAFNPAAQPIGYSATYKMEDLVVSTVAASTEEVDGKLRIHFNQQYAEAKLKLPRSLDMSKIVNITVKVEGQTVPIAVKLYKKGTQKWVNYFNNFLKEYAIVPYLSDEINEVGIMSLVGVDADFDYADIESITFNLTEEPAPIPVSNDIVTNGYFNAEEIDDWKAAFWGDGVTMTQVVSATPIFGDVYTYGAYSKRTSPYQCFAQDITDKVEQNEKYTFSFWARLSEDYKGAPENMRVVQFAPYTVDTEGNPDYNPKLEGTYSQVLEPGVWTKFEGTYKVTNANEVGQVIIRILEQGTNYGQGDCVMGAYDVTAVVMEKYIPEPPSIDEDVPALKDAITDVFGEDFVVGSAISGDEGDDIGVEMLINKHFNALTIGNELKPDALFGYSNSQHTKLQTIEFNGQELVVPTLDFSRAEMILDQIKKWNETHPDEPIKVRGHVLVWHAQTPEWFFRENYVVAQNADGSENYVTPEVMNLRLEWFIKTVLEHFTGADSEYKDMFYGWDVVNEAIGDGGNGYRTNKVSSMESPSAATHSKNSSWWAVYQSNEYIIKAFQYANKYAPADVELYYNDYNDADSKKVIGIVALLKDVLAAEGTRIDAMGMQGHYNLFNPSNKSIESAIRAYAEVVGAVQYTELDFKASGNISSEKGLKDEYAAQAERYHDIYLLLQKLDAEEGIEITGLTVWGTVDHYSWLQSASDVGGGAEVEMDQCPLLFDSNYKVKPSYWAFVDYTQVDPDWVPEEPKSEVKDDKTEDKDTDKDTEKENEKEDDVKVDSSEEGSTEESEDAKESETADDAKDVTSETPSVKKSNPWPIVAVAAVVVIAVAVAGVVMIKRKKK